MTRCKRKSLHGWRRIVPGGRTSADGRRRSGPCPRTKNNRGHGPLLQLKPLLIADTIAVGLALPPAQGKRRIALSVAANDIARYTPPLRLADAIAHAPAAWQPALAELDAAAIDIDLELRVFGSLAWQALSGMQYLTPQSDIDLLWHPQSHAQLQQGIALLARWEQDQRFARRRRSAVRREQRRVMARMGYIEVRRRSARIGEARIQRGTGRCRELLELLA